MNTETTPRIFTEMEQKCIEKYRDCNVDYEGWCEFTIEDFITQVAKIGLRVSMDDVQFSGFCSQGDGASFTLQSGASLMDMLTASRAALSEEARDGGPLADMVYGIAEEHEKTWSLVALCPDYIDALSEIYVRTRRTSHHYSHSRTVTAWLDREDQLAGDEGHDAFNTLIGAFCDTVDGMIEGLADQLYKDLEAEHNYLCSDEAVWDTIEANEWYADFVAENSDDEEEEEDEDEEPVAKAA
jgi:hypothetical protein